MPHTLHTAHRRRRIRLASVVVLATAVVVLTGTSSAPTAWARTPPPDTHERSRGLMAVAAVGMDGCTGRQCANTYPLMYTRLHLLYRALPYLAAGVHTAFNFLAPAFPSGGARVEFWELLVGPEVRGLFPIKQLDIWVGFALGYYRSYRLVDDDGHEIESATGAFGLGWGLGLDYYLIHGRYGDLAIGGDVWFYKPFPTELCSTIGDNPTACVDSGIADQFGVTYAAGVTLTWFISI